MPGTLYVRCIEARFLPGKKTANGYSDPYVKFKMKESKFKTTMVQRCLHPVWGEDFIIPVDGDVLSMSVWDANRFSQNEVIGSCDILLQPIMEKGKSTDWHSLVDTKGASLGGAAVLLSIVFRPEAGRDAAYSRALLDHTTAAHSALEEKRELRPLSLQIVTWNVGNQAPSDDFSHLIPKSQQWDIVAVGLQESRHQDGSDEKWQEAIAKHLGTDYFSVAAQCLWEIGLYVFAHKSHLATIHSVEQKVESTGIGHVMGNKGGVAISLCHNDLSMCFVSSHLAAQMTKKERRNKDVAEIIGGTKMGFKAQTDILNQYHHVFWMGDLNYRLDYGNPETDSPSKEVFKEVVDLINANKMDELFAYDQLTKERLLGNVFADFEEGSMIHFPPTFKVERKSGFTYNPQRCPAWTDRILWKSLATVPAARQTSLSAGTLVSTSDHKPVIGTFELGAYSAPMGFDSSVGECSIVITSLEGKNLRAADVNGFSDPFIYFFSTFTESGKTTTINKTLNPVWTAKDLPKLISFANSRARLRQSFLKVVAFDQDVGSADDEIGYGVLYLEALSAAGPNLDVPFTVQLTFEGLPAGRLTGTFQLQFRPAGEKSSSPPSANPKSLLASSKNLLSKSKAQLLG